MTAAFSLKGLLNNNRGTIQITVRYANRINVQKPRPPHYERQKIEALVAPKFFEKGERDRWFLPIAEQCLKQEELDEKKKTSEDNPHQRLLAKDLRNWFMNSKLIAFFHENPIKFDPRFEAEVKLRKENMYMKKLGRHTVEMALESTQYTAVLPLFSSSTVMVFCSDPKLDKLLKVTSKLHHYVLLAAIVEDRLMSVSQLKSLSQVKDITTARAQLVSLLNTVQSQMVASLIYHQSNLVGGLQQYAESGTAQTTPEPDQT